MNIWPVVSGSIIATLIGYYGGDAYRADQLANDCTKLGTTIINGQAFKCGLVDTNRVL